MLILAIRQKVIWLINHEVCYKFYPLDIFDILDTIFLRFSKNEKFNPLSFTSILMMIILLAIYDLFCT